MALSYQSFLAFASAVSREGRGRTCAPTAFENIARPVGALRGPDGLKLDPMKRHIPALAMILMTLGAALPALSQLPPLIPRDVLFGNPERTSPRLSPDGKRLAWVAPDPKNVLQVWVKTIGQNDEKMVTADKKRGIRQYSWAKDDRTLLYMQDTDGDENFHVYGVDLVTGNVRDFTPIQGVRAAIVGLSEKFPNEVLIQMNARKRETFDAYRLNLETGALVLDTENPGDVMAWLADDDFKVRLGSVSTPEGGTELRVRDSVTGPWRSWMKVGADENLGPLDFTKDGKAVFIESSLGSDTARVLQRDLATGSEKLIAHSPEVDAGDVMIHPRTRVVEAVSFEPGRSEWKVIDPAVQADFAALAKVRDGDFSIVSRDRADQTWLVAYTSDRGPGRFYSWDRAAQKATLLFTSQPKLEGLTLAEMKAVVIPARDGLKLHSYLTLPAGVPAKNLPMILMVHGGPWARDNWGYNPYAQWFANRGYACLQVNFRGSTGYGKKFLNAGNKQWGLKMHDDLLDATDWAVAQGYADPKRVAVFGGSYGGYAALAALTFTPEKFACAVDIVGPSNIRTLLGTIPPYWKPMLAMFAVRVGDVNDPKEAELVKNASPLFKADKIVRPLLIGQGANDPRVKQSESEQIVDAIIKNGGNVTYVVYPDEGHGFARPENRIDFNARAEAFLAANLGGRTEPVAGGKVPGSTAVVKTVQKGKVVAAE
jgi:dipeptidyl aminopeptidase/acylaminoacyl peptidase